PRRMNHHLARLVAAVVAAVSVVDAAAGEHGVSAAALQLCLTRSPQQNTADDDDGLRSAGACSSWKEAAAPEREPPKETPQTAVDGHSWLLDPQPPAASCYAAV